MKRAFYISLFTLTGMFSFSQLTIKPGIGLTVTSLGVTNGSASAKPNGLIGGSVMIGKGLYIEPGIFWVWKSSHVTSNSSSSTTQDFNTSLSGIRIPLSIGFHLLGSDSSGFHLRVFGGGSAYFITNNSAALDQVSLNKAIWAVHAGAGVDIWHLFLDASYEWSLTNLQSASQNPSSVQVGKMNSLYIVAGINLTLGH
jgi:hypothetical protein